MQFLKTRPITFLTFLAGSTGLISLAAIPAISQTVNQLPTNVYTAPDGSVVITSPAGSTTVTSGGSVPINSSVTQPGTTPTGVLGGSTNAVPTTTPARAEVPVRILNQSSATLYNSTNNSLNGGLNAPGNIIVLPGSSTITGGTGAQTSNTGSTSAVAGTGTGNGTSTGTGGGTTITPSPLKFNYGVNPVNGGVNPSNPVPSQQNSGTTAPNNTAPLQFRGQFGGSTTPTNPTPSQLPAATSNPGNPAPLRFGGGTAPTVPTPQQ